MVDLILVSGSYSPREGGAERQMRQILTRQASRGSEIVVITQVLPKVKLPRRELRDGYTIFRVGSRFAFRRAPRAGQLFFWISATALSLVLRPARVVSLQMGSASVSGAIAARFWRVPHVLRLTGGGTPQHRSEPLARVASPVGRIISRMFSRRKTTIVAPADHLIADFRESFPSFPGRYIRILNGVVPPASEPEKTAEVVWYARSGSEVSTTDFYKIALLMPDVHFEVIGRAELADPPANVSVRGWLKNPEVEIGKHRVLLNTSWSEGMPNTVLQAIGWGTRAVGFANAGMREVQSMHPAFVQLAQLGDVKELAILVRSALEMPLLNALPGNVQTIEQVDELWSDLLFETEE